MLLEHYGGGQLTRIESTAKGLELEPATKWSSKLKSKASDKHSGTEPVTIWLKVTEVLADENFLCFYYYLRDNFDRWKEFVEEIQVGMALVLEPIAEPFDISGQLES